MTIRGIGAVITVQVTEEEIDGIENLKSCAQGEYCIYVDMNEYFDKGESFDVIDEFLDNHTAPDVICLFV